MPKLARSWWSVRLVVVTVLVAGCGTAPTPVPTNAPPSVVATPAAAGSPAPEATPSSTATQEPSVPAGYVRVRFHLDLTGDGVPAATFGLEVQEVGRASSGPRLLCSAHGGAPACRNGGGYEMSYDFPLGATVDYRFYQELDPSGSPTIDIFPREFVVSATSTYKAQTYDVQP